MKPRGNGVPISEIKSAEVARHPPIGNNSMRREVPQTRRTVDVHRRENREFRVHFQAKVVLPALEHRVSPVGCIPGTDSLSASCKQVLSISIDCQVFDGTE